MPDIFVQSFSHLKNKYNADQALLILKRIASLVKPIMRKRNWVLPGLAEFFPDNPNLLGLNVNMGETIYLRLRPDNAPDTFLPEETMVETMLHELTHNVHGPHDDKFYNYLSGLQDEFDALQRSGYAGEGFFSEGKRLGANVSHNDPPHIARRKALEAAEKRRQTSRVLGEGGRLGGGPGGQNGNAGLSLRELAARAAERRLRDEKSCASGPEAQREAEKAANESNVIDLADDIHMLDFDSDSDVIIVEDAHWKPLSSRSVVGPSSVSQRNFKPSGSSSSSSSANKSINIDSSSASPIGKWSCQACTLLNPYMTLQCEACGMRRPPDEREGWTCFSCDEPGQSHNFWTCWKCGTTKLQS